MPIQTATKEDIPALIKLLNCAYRGEESKKGWTHEADLIHGEIRTDASVLENIFNDSLSVFLKYVNDDGQVTGCVHLQKQDHKLYLGMLAVNPVLQAAGVGGQLLLAAEEIAIAKDCDTITMTVISARHDLIDWYERKGYHKTGIQKSFPNQDAFGSPTQQLYFEIMEKKIITIK
jgi:ribosomal protein S18 acetylase RimI-like enzyme